MIQSDDYNFFETCLSQVSSEIYGLKAMGARVNTNTQAIYTMSVCDLPDIENKLKPLHTHYRAACLYAHAKIQTDIPWILSQLRADAKSTVNRSGSGLQSHTFFATTTKRPLA